MQAAFRKKGNSQKDTAIVSAWLRRGEILAQEQQCAQFDKDKFQASLTAIRSLTIIDESEDFVPKLKSICATAGVAVVLVPALRGLGIYGATRRLNDKYVMQLSLYGKSHDQLWFTIFHEICHIIKHSRRELYIEGKHLESEKAKEDEADAFAGDFLIPPKQLSHFLASVYKPTVQQIKRFATSIGIAPGIVVGRLQHDRKLPMSCGNDLKVYYRWMDS